MTPAEPTLNQVRRDPFPLRGRVAVVVTGGSEAVVAGVAGARAEGQATVAAMDSDITEPDAPSRLIEAARQAHGHLDILVCNHARSGGDGPLGALTAAMLDAHRAVNTRSSILLAQAW